MQGTLKLSQALRVGRFSADPSDVGNGVIYYNTASDEFFMYQGGAFTKITDQSVIDALAAADIAYKTLDGSKINIDAASDDVKSALDDLDGAIGDLTFVPTNYTDPASDDVSAHLQEIDSALANAGSTDFSDAEFRISDDADSSKKIAFQASGITTSTTRTVTMSDANVDLSEVNSSIQQDGSRAFSANQSMGSFKLTNLADPTNAQDAATKAYVDAIKQGLDVKASVRAASSANVDLTVAGDGTLDGVTLADGDRVLLKDQSTASENGIYDAVSAADQTTWIRSSDADEDAEVTAGLFTFVAEGTSNADSGWLLTTDDPITVGTTALSFAQFSGAGQITAGEGLTKTGNTLDVNVDDVGVEIVSDALQLKDAGVTDAKVATGIDAAKLADGSVSNAEFQHLDGVTSDIQPQLNAKLENVVEDLTPELGGNLETGGNDIEAASAEILLAGQNSVRRAKQASKADFIEESYIHGISLAASQTDAVISELTFAHATFEGMEMVYKVKEDTTSSIRIGTVRVVTDGTNVVLNDMGTELSDTGITFDAVINGANVEITYSSGANGAVMRADVKRILA